MRLELFRRMGVTKPEYAGAPAALVERHMQLSGELASLYESGESLSSEKMLAVAEQIREVNRQIAAYYPENQK